jgi:hypothetical protein
MNRSIILPALVTAFVALSPAGVAVADNPHAGPPAGSGGQPGKEEVEGRPDLSPPGHSSDGFENVASQHYAGEQPQNSKNPKSVSQYDVAGFQQCMHRSADTSICQ